MSDASSNLKTATNARFSELPLLACALLIGLRAQKAKQRPMHEVLAKLLHTHSCRAKTPFAARRAAYRATRIFGWFGLLDTCIVRALIVCTLLKEHKQLQIHIGFRDADGTSLAADGHTWVMLNGSNVSDWQDGGYTTASIIDPTQLA